MLVLSRRQSLFFSCKFFFCMEVCAGSVLSDIVRVMFVRVRIAGVSVSCASLFKLYLCESVFVQIVFV
jgi:hypothetical protein